MAVAFGVLLMLLCLCSYASAPQSAAFFEAVNPWSTLMGLAFVLTYFGLPLAVAVVAEVILLLLVLWGLFVLARRLFK